MRELHHWGAGEVGAEGGDHEREEAAGLSLSLLSLLNKANQC